MTATTILALVGLSTESVGAPIQTDHQVQQEVQRELPRSSLDYSALTLDPGQVRLGLDDLDVCPMRGLQIGTNPLLDAVGVYNLRARLGSRFGRHLAMAVDGSGNSLHLGQLNVTGLRAGARASAWAGPVGVHGVVAVSRQTVQGSPDITRAAPLVTALVGAERLNSVQAVIDQAVVDLSMQATTVSLQAAAELHLTRAHALVVQAGRTLSRSVGLQGQAQEVAAALPGDDVVSELINADGSHTTWVSAAWQVVGKRLNLRGGVGLSDVPLAWLVPSLELSWRLGRTNSDAEQAQQEPRPEPGNS